ncbi:unannotated protein [freshwater metagenome]|uniref:Unannotated protein n=1 Tax=freshwater metagenome TaxID=449393 RepID=A0A6J7EWY6_9ZZZZ
MFSHPCELDLIGLVRAAGFSVARQVLLTSEDRAVHRVAHLDLDEETTRRYA